MSPAELAMRRRNDRWAAHGRARVALPGRKAVVVPCASPFAAIQCAAELWGVPWQEVVHGARVMWAPGGENPIAHRARYIIYIIAYSCPPCKPKNADAARRFQLR